MLWRGTMRTCEVLFRNVRELALDSFKAQDVWRLIIDFPFDREGYTPQPPVGANLNDALEHLLAQALAHQFPTHPDFGAAEVRRPSLRRVLDVVQQATQARDGRVEVERSAREEVRRIAV